MKIIRNYSEAASLLLEGKVGVIPTDTIYGLCAVAANEVATRKMYQLKNREKNPGTLIAPSLQQLVDLGIKKRYLTAVERYWPGPVSVVIPLGFALPYLHLGKQSLAVRIPKDDNLTELLNKTGPLITTSANQPNESPASTIEDAKKYFGKEVDFYLDGGDLSGKEPSTIIRVIDDTIEVLRQGAVKIDEETGRVIK